MLVDAFAGGRIVTVDEAHARMKEMLGAEVEWSDDLLQPVSNRHWLTRMLQNLLHTFGNSGHFADVAAMLEMEMLLWPQRGQLQRDLARSSPARPVPAGVGWLDRYLKNNPDDPQNELTSCWAYSNNIRSNPPFADRSASPLRSFFLCCWPRRCGLVRPKPRNPSVPSDRIGGLLQFGEACGKHAPSPLHAVGIEKHDVPDAGDSLCHRVTRSCQ